MRVTIRKFVVVAMVGFIFVCLGSASAFAEKKIGVIVWSEEKRYSDAKDGMLAALKKDGFSEPKIKFVIKNAGGSKAKAAEIAKSFSSGYEIILAIGTSAAVEAAYAVKDVPLIFSMVYDPVDSKIAADWTSSGNNTTGASPRVPMSKLISELKQFAGMKKLAVLYTAGEKNSETQLRELQAEQQSGIIIVPVPVSSRSEVEHVIEEVVSRVDAVYLSGSGVVGESVNIIVDAATKGKIVTVSHLEDYIEKGVMLGVCASPRAVGQLAGEKAAKVLKGAKPASIPIETLRRLDVIINMKTAKAAQRDVPPSLLKSATRIIR